MFRHVPLETFHPVVAHPRQPSHQRLRRASQAFMDFRRPRQTLRIYGTGEDALQTFITVWKLPDDSWTWGNGMKMQGAWWIFTITKQAEGWVIGSAFESIYEQMDADNCELQLVQTMLRKECKCHGMSGSCTLRTCWKKLPTFRRIAENLTEKYRRAKPVVAVVTSTSINTTAVQANTSTTEQATSGGTRPRRSLVLLKSKDFSPMSISSVVKVRRSMPAVRTTPRRSDLVYLDASPNYCELDQGTGSQGTKSRRCLHSTQVNSSTHENSCDVLCCGRGYNTHQKLHTWKCNCRFRWCCEVECHQCKELLEIYTCK